MYLWAQKIALDALTFTISIAKQAAISFGIALVTWAASKAIDYVKNLKTHSEELVETMNDSHDAAEQATKDVEEIQSKIDELNDSIKAAGVKKIEDIVDPAERERLQAINDTLQAQLELKKQLEKDAADKANADTSAVVNDKTEFSINKKKTTYLDANGEVTTDPKYAVTTIDGFEKVSKTESLHEYAAALEDTTQKRRDLQVELDQIEASSGKDSKEYANKKKELDALNETFESQKTKVEELSTAVSEQMGNYKTDADSFAQYKDEYVAGTNAMTEATKALANAQDNTGIDTTNLDIFSEKIKQIKNDIDNGDSQQSDWKTFNGLDAFDGMSGEAIINIDKDSSHQTETETAALEKLHKTADENKISFESLIGVFESFGLVQISNSATADDYADKLEKTMGVIDNIQSAYKACKIGQYNQVLEYLDTHAKNGTISLNQLKDAIEGVNTALDEATGKTDEFQSGMEILHDLSKIDNANGEQIADYDTLKKVTELVTKHQELDGIFLDENGNLNVDDDKIKKAAEVLVGKIINAANDSGQTGLAKLWSNRLEQLNKGDISMTDFWNGFGTDIEDANTKIDKFQSTFSAFRSALEEIQETGSLKSQDTLQELGQIDQSFLDQFIQDDGTYKINATGLRDMYVKQLEPLMKEFDGTVYGDYLKKMYDAVRAPTEEEYDVLVKATLEYKVAKEKYDRAVGRIDSSDASDEDKEAAKKAALDELTAVYNQKYQDVQETDAQVMAKLIAHWEDAKNAVESFKSALSDAKDVLSSLLSLLSSANDKSNNDLKIWGDAMGKVIDKRIEALNKQKEALEENNEATERAIELSKAQDALARAQQQRTTRVYTENGYEWQANAEDVRTAREDLADKQREWNNKDAEKAIDDQIKKYNEFKDKLSEVMDDIGKSWKDYQKELEYYRKICCRYELRQGKGYRYTFRCARQSEAL